jgi:hypothetical protein
MAIEKEIIQSEIRATGAKQVQDDMIKINQAMKDLTQEEKNLLFIKNKLESQGKKNTEEYKNNAAALKLNKEAATKNREELTKLNGQLKITDMSYNQLSKRAAELRSHLNNVKKNIEPEKWHALNNELQATKKQISLVNGGTQQTSSIMGTLTKSVGFLGVGFLSAATAMKAGKAIMEATQFTADAFEKTMAGLKGMVDYFFISISSGDWTNFWEGLSKSKKSAEELAETMDALGDIRRGLDIEEVRNENKKNELLLDLRDKTGRVTKDQKEKLYAQLLEIDKNYNAKVLDAANRERDGILNTFSDITGLRNDQIFSIISNFSNYEKQFNNAAESLRLARQQWLADTQIGQANGSFDTQKYIDGLSDADRFFTQLYLKYGKLNDANLDNLKNSIIAVEQALGAGSRTQLEYVRLYNEIFKDKDANKNYGELSDEELRNRAYDSVLEEDLKKGDEFAEKSQKQVEEYAEQAFQAVHDKADEAQKLELEKFYNAARYELDIWKETSEGKKAVLKEQLEQSEIWEREYQDKITEIDYESNQARLNIYSKFFSSISGLFKKNTLAYKVAAAAEATIATFAAAAKANKDYKWPLSLVVMASVIAEGLAQVAQINKVKLWTGGYTGQGDKYKPVGVVHANEYVVSSDELAQPEVRSFVGSVVEPMRMKRLGYSPYAQSTTMPGYANGGFTGQSSQPAADNTELKAMLAANMALMNHLIREGVNANFDENKIKEMRDRVARQEAMDARAKR